MNCRASMFWKRISAALLPACVLLCVSACMASCAGDESLRILTYPEFLPQELIDSFEEEYGISVAVDYCNTEEELLTKWMIDKGGAGYDMSVPYTGSLQALRESGTIQELDFSHIPNYQYLTEESLRFDDPEDVKYAVPYVTMSGYEWIYNPSRCPIEPKVFEDLTNPALKSQIVMAPSAQVWINRALLHVGYEANSYNEEEIRTAVEWLKKMKPNIKVFDGAKPSTSLINGECSIALTYSSDAAEALYQYPEIKAMKLEDYQFRIQTQVFCVAKKTKNKEKAELFINWIHEPEHYAFCLDKYPYMSCNSEALNYTGEKYNSIRYLFDIPEGSEMFQNQDLGDAIVLYDKYWSAFMSY